MSGLNSYDRIAPIYDRLAGIVFGKAIRRAQHVYLPSLGDAREVLILGGGTGWLLADLLHMHSTVRVTYLEASQRMIELAEEKIKDADRPRVVFVHGTQTSLQGNHYFDAVIINFFVDMFSETELKDLLKLLRSILRPDGQLLCTDFIDDVWWQKLMLRVMYGFFRLTTGLRNRRLAPWRGAILDGGFKLIQVELFWRRFICSQQFRKV